MGTALAKSCVEQNTYIYSTSRSGICMCCSLNENQGRKKLKQQRLGARTREMRSGIRSSIDKEKSQ